MNFTDSTVDRIHFLAERIELLCSEGRFQDAHALTLEAEAHASELREFTAPA